MIPQTQRTNPTRNDHLASSVTVADGGTHTTRRVDSEGAREVEVIVVAGAAHNFDVQFQVAGVESGALSGPRSVESSGGDASLAFVASVLGAEYAVQVANNDGGGVGHDYDVYVREVA